MQGVPAADGRLEQLVSWLAELESQNCLLEKQRAETEKVLVDEKQGKRRTTLCADSFVFKLINTLSGLEKEVRTLKRDLTACEKANAELQKAREAAEAREGATEGKLRLELQAREGMVLKPLCFLFGMNSQGVEMRPCCQVRRLGSLRLSRPWASLPAR